MEITFKINWVDTLADAVSVTFSSMPEDPISVRVNRSDPDSWPQTISDHYRTLPIAAEALIDPEVAKRTEELLKSDIRLVAPKAEAVLDEKAAEAVAAEVSTRK